MADYVISDNVSYFPVDGSMDLVSGLFGQSGYQSGPVGDGSVRFRATCMGLSIFGYGNGQVYRVAVDGVDSDTTFAGVSDSWQWITLGSSYDGGAEHEYIISGHAQQCNFSAVRTTGGTANTTATLAPLATWAFYGDSITDGRTGGTGSDNGLSYAHRLGLSQRVGIRNRGTSGARVFGYLDSSTTQVTGATVPPARVVVLAGVNDGIFIADAGAETVADFQASYQAMVQALINGLPPGTAIDCLTLLDTNSDAISQRDALKTAQAAAIAACTNRSHVRNIVTDGWINPGTDTPDGLHPTAAGYTKVVAAYLALAAVIPRVSPVLSSPLGSTLGPLGGARPRAAAAPPAFDPLSIAGLQLWLKADALSYANGDPVTSFDDQSGNSYTPTATGAACPTFATGVINGKPVVRFDGATTRIMVCVPGAFGSLGAMTLFFLLRPAASGGAAHQFFFCVSRLSDAWNIALNPAGQLEWWNDGLNALSISATANADNMPVLLALRHDPAGSPKTTFYRNGTADGTDNAVKSTSGVSGYYFGNCNIIPADVYHGDIAEVLVYDSALSSTDRDSVTTYLKTKYGL